VSSSPPSRPSLREIQKDAARAHIANAASDLFLERGYGGTKTKDVAAAAGVAEGTIFNLFGSKSELLLAALRERVPTERSAEDRRQVDCESFEDPDALIDFVCTLDEIVANRAIGVVEVFLEAAESDPQVAERWRAQEEVRYESQQHVLDLLEARGWLRTDRARDALARDVWLTLAPELHVKVKRAGVPLEDFKAWKATALRALLVDPD